MEPTTAGAPTGASATSRPPATLAERYPSWDDFAAVRARLDPAGAFRNDYTDRVLGPAADAA